MSVSGVSLAVGLNFFVSQITAVLLRDAGLWSAAPYLLQWNALGFSYPIMLLATAKLGISVRGRLFIWGLSSLLEGPTEM